MMAGIRGQGNQSTEIKLARLLRKQGITGWRRHQPFLGKPDFVFKEKRVVIFVDGCFWHGCSKCYKKPSSNKNFWAEKLANNKKRDHFVTRSLIKMGWDVLRLWECSIKNGGTLATKIARRL